MNIVDDYLNPELLGFSDLAPKSAAGVVICKFFTGLDSLQMSRTWVNKSRIGPQQF